MADFNKGIELQPKYATTYDKRGLLKQFQGDLDGALSDFLQYDALSSYRFLHDYAHLRIWVLRVRKGETAQANQELSDYLAKRSDGKPEDWPALIGNFLLGQMAESDFLAAATSSDENRNLVAAIRTNAQARVNQLKSGLATQVANFLTGELSKSFSLYENWFDPFLGLRGRYNLTKALYLTGEADVGGFGVGSEITWETYAALGCQITRNIYSEVGYRYLYLDYDTTSFIFQGSVRGAQITVGINF